MELILLDSNFMETGRYSNFDSLVWNERYQSPGDFQLRSYGIMETMRHLQRDAFVSVSNSDYVMQIHDISLSIDSENHEVLTVKGKTLDYIYGFRPAVPKISSTTSMDADNPDGWDFGDEYGEYGEVDPLDVIDQVLRDTDHRHYGREELSGFTLPIQYYSIGGFDGTRWAITTRPLPGGSEGRWSTSNKLIYYSIDRGSTVLDVMTEMMIKAEVGFAVMKPNDNSEVARFHYLVNSLPGVDKPVIGVFYRPRWLCDKVEFSYHYEDYVSETVEDSNSVPTDIVVATEDNVGYGYLDRPWASGTGFSKRLMLLEESRDDMAEELYQKTHVRMGEAIFDEYASVVNLSVETTGNFPYSPKMYKFGQHSDNTYFLGDAVRLNLRGGSYDVQISEYIRTIDGEGYREYPTFTLLKKLGDYRSDIVGEVAANAVRHNWN